MAGHFANQLLHPHNVQPFPHSLRLQCSLKAGPRRPPLIIERLPAMLLPWPLEKHLQKCQIVKTIQETWDKVEDKYAVPSLAVAGVVALWGSAGMLSAINRLPFVPGVLELVGIGYTGWFAYQNLIYINRTGKL